MLTKACVASDFMAPHTSDAPYRQRDCEVEARPANVTGDVQRTDSTHKRKANTVDTATPVSCYAPF